MSTRAVFTGMPGGDLTFTVSVRALAEFACPGHDLLPGAGIRRMREGAETHRLLQGKSEGEGASERAVALLYHHNNVDLKVVGRIDILRETDGLYTVEEIKLGARQTVEPAHWTQAAIYAHLLAAELGLDRVVVRVLYADTDGQTRAVFESEETRESLDAVFRGTAEPYCVYLAGGQSRKLERDASIARMRFPYDEPRPGQRALANHTMRAVRLRRRLFAEAPTGIGKTCAVLYPAVRALEKGLTEHVFFLTARTTARQAAWDAVALMRRQGVVIRSVVLTAREKCCPYAGAAGGAWSCSMVGCPEAEGFYDRLAEAQDVIGAANDWTAEAIASTARAYRLCPHELSLALAESADIIICDYNYAFDPAVQLRRIFRSRAKFTLLIDEAHHIVERTRSMLSAALSSAAVREARREAGAAFSRKSPLYAALTQLIGVLEGMPIWRESERLDAPPDGLSAAVTAALDNALAHLQLAPLPRAQSMSRDLMAMKSALDRGHIPYAWLARKEGGAAHGGRVRAALQALCLDPSPHLYNVTKQAHGCVYFSATLSPLDQMRDFIGGDADDALLSLPSPFPAENFAVMCRAHPTVYKARATSAEAVAQTAAAFVRACPGNVWLCFPSYAYMNSVRMLLAGIMPDAETSVQSGRMTEADREAFLERFRPGGMAVGMIVLGGSFGESVDMIGDRLVGVAIVGVGLPQVNGEQETLRAYYDERYSDGFAFAYRIPGMHKVIQAAGRVIRSASDRGAVLLIDDRYAAEEYAGLFPAHWDHVAHLGSDGEMAQLLEEFFTPRQESPG